MLNLNNALNAVSGLPLKTQLLNRHWRLLLAAAMREWLVICQHERVQPYQFTAIKPALLPWILCLPDWLFRRVAARMLRIDPQARLSMSADITAGRRTEIAFLNGAVVTLGQRYGIPTPVNEAIVDWVHQKERQPDVAVNPFHLCQQLQLC
ncbi:MAG: ketopantoate reductase C-terminal domain-containing protein [Rheinheimera sp.]|nr:ketopantoate reductase C-terminal domain-containing protein [Rheinheimera sp.]